MTSAPGTSQNSCGLSEAVIAFSSALKEHQLYFSPTDFSQLQESVKHIAAVANGKIQHSKVFNLLAKLHDALDPYFKVVGIFVSAKPEVAAFVWGAIRLILQLTLLLEQLAVSFSQYGEVHKHCATIDRLKHSRIPGILEAIYKDVFEIFQSCTQLFVKRDGRPKKTIIITGHFLWKSFNNRFQDQLSSLSDHRKEFMDELVVSQMCHSMSDSVRNYAFGDMVTQFIELSTEEIESARKERDLAQKEREIRAMDTRQLNEGTSRLELSLRKIQEALRNLEIDRMNSAGRNIGEWLAPPRFTDAFDQARRARQSCTASWIFQEDKYQSWLGAEMSTFQPANMFGPNVLWIHGNPGSGKTVLAASIVENLQSQLRSRPTEICYYFFDHRSPAETYADSAYRSLLSQLLSFSQHDEILLDKFSFAVHNSWNTRGQLEAGKTALMDLLSLSLSRDSILVLDGIDECEDKDDFVAFLLDVWKGNMPHIIFLSRVNVTSLKRYVPKTYQLQMSKNRVSEDIRVFSTLKLESLFGNRILSSGNLSRKSDMVERMVHGSNGMFLWARLMINFLESPYLDELEKMSVFEQINTPEGLEVMYSRIVRLILASGQKASRLASNILLRLIHAPVPISSRHIWQSLFVDGLRSTPEDLEHLQEFEDSIIMACGGLIERTTIHDPQPVFQDEPSLRLIHLSVSETLTSFHSIPSLIGWGEADLPLLADQATGSLDCATTCLKQLLYHTPRQPLSGGLAISWLLHLQDFIRAASATISLFQGTWSFAFQQALHNFWSQFNTFLNTPATISVWLEAFYTYPYQDSLAHPLLSPLDGLAIWAKQAISLGFRVPFDSKFATCIELFRNEVHNAVSIWGMTLHAMPCTVWDEMTGFMDNNRFFWSSHSTRLTYQQPTAPLQPIRTQEPAALMSRTSGSGELKATLCIWGNALYHDSNLKARVSHSQRSLDLFDLCSGWIATYEVWKIQPDTTRLARGEVSIRPEELRNPMKNYMNVSGASIAGLPMAINSQLNTFVILGTLYSLNPTQHKSEPVYKSFFLPIQMSGTENYQWTPLVGRFPWPDTHSVTFSDGNQHFALLESNATDQQSLTICQYAHSQHLDMKILNVMTISPGIRRIEKVIFHPTHHLIAFCGFSSMTTTGWQNAAFLWAYTRDVPKIFPLAHGYPSEAVGFSSCGLFFVSRPRYSTQSPQVLQIPPELLEHTRPALSETTLRSSTVVAEPENNKVAFYALHQSAATEVWKVDDDRRVSSFGVQASETGICVTAQSHQGTQVSNLVTLPMWQGASETAQRVLLPQFEGDSLKISVDVDTQNLSPGSTYQLAKAGGNIKPSVIYRDPRFVALSNMENSVRKELAWPSAQENDTTGREF
ncbi:hypothetical protein FGADI_4159 [Fusarium gaditjirri]|uniref:Nephrocystin 3-like N-terminal domain-containing protein n=1 Tax=Fusarium gaditjirri TaxID=282569 RepID=A0A8H4TDM1_9HYPO|nr:hypothetical protein FGADI_4159 [Fusarium gaditjirri]